MTKSRYRRTGFNCDGLIIIANCKFLVQFAKIGTQKLTDVINEYMAGISIANGVPYEREPIRMLPSRAFVDP